jgi:hypothetical protein
MSSQINLHLATCLKLVRLIMNWFCPTSHLWIKGRSRLIEMSPDVHYQTAIVRVSLTFSVSTFNGLVNMEA